MFTHDELEAVFTDRLEVCMGGIWHHYVGDGLVKTIAGAIVPCKLSAISGIRLYNPPSLPEIPAAGGIKQIPKVKKGLFGI